MYTNSCCYLKNTLKLKIKAGLLSINVIIIFGEHE